MLVMKILKKNTNVVLHLYRMHILLCRHPLWWLRANECSKSPKDIALSLLSGIIEYPKFHGI